MTIRRTAETREDCEHQLSAIRKEVAAHPYGEYTPKAGNTNLYFVQGANGGPIKIGLARNVERRIKALQASLPVILRLLYVIPNASQETELYLHTMFAEHRLHGEWFKARAVNFFVRKHRENPKLLVPGAYA